MQTAQLYSVPRGAPPPYETIFTPASGVPFRISFSGKGIEVTGLLTTPESADELVGAINALKVLLRPAVQAMRPAWTDSTFKSGDRVPASGFYNVHHAGHIGSGQTEYSEGQRFKSCDQCQEQSAVRYSPAQLGQLQFSLGS